MGAIQYKELRKEERQVVNIPTKIRGINGKIWSDSQMVNISKSGACLKSTFTVRPGNTIMLSSSSSNSSVYCIPAKVVWYREGVFGVRFIGSS